MATGVEAAGLVLGSIPLILAGLEFYGKGIAVTRRYLRYREGLKSVATELSAEHAKYKNTINLLLIGVVKPQELAEFLADPCGARWKEEKFERNLKRRLGTSYDSYMGTICELRRTAEAFKQKLKLDSSGKPQFTDEQTFKKYYKRLEFSLRKSDYDDLMASLRRANSSLDQLTTQCRSLETLQASSKPDHQSVPNFKVINDRAQGFHSALATSWNCPCHANHSVSLRLEPRMEDVQSKDDADEGEESMRDPFHVVFRYSHDILAKSGGSAATRNPWAWEEADVRITIERKSQIATASATGSVGCGKTVRFESHAKSAVKAALDVTPNLQPIQDLCAAIGTLQKPQRDVCLSLLANEYAKQKYGILIYPSKEPPADTDAWSISSLRSVLEDSGFARRHRLKLAVTLSSSVLQLHETPWLDENWGKDDILFIKRSGKTAYDHPFVSQGFDHGQRSSHTAPTSMRSIIRNQTLYALGVCLIELWYGKPMSGLHMPGDGPSDDPMTEWRMADRLVEELYDEAGDWYGDAVRRCIRCNFDRRGSSLDDVGFQKDVYQGVVTQLKENVDSMFKPIGE